MIRPDNDNTRKLVRETYFLMMDRGWLALNNQPITPIQSEIDNNITQLRLELHCPPGIDLESEVRAYCDAALRQAL